MVALCDNGNGVSTFRFTTLMSTTRTCQPLWPYRVQSSRTRTVRGSDVSATTC